MLNVADEALECTPAVTSHFITSCNMRATHTLALVELDYFSTTYLCILLDTSILTPTISFFLVLTYMYRIFHFRLQNASHFFSVVYRGICSSYLDSYRIYNTKAMPGSITDELVE